MNIGNKVNSIIKELGDLMLSVNLMECDDASVPNRAFRSINFIRSVLTDFQERINTIEGKRILAESQRDSLLLAIAGTNEGRNLDLTSQNEAIGQAMTVVRTMDADIRTMREAEEIPFGAVEQDHDKMQLEQRIAELELQFELKVDEYAATESHLREFKARWISLINLINNLYPDGVNIAGSIAYVDKYFAKSESPTIVTHELKILPEHFEAVEQGIKKAEIRQVDRIDRVFSVGDELLLREWTQEKKYTGRETYRVVTHITDLKAYAPGYVMLSIESIHDVGGKTLEEKYIEKYRAKHP